MTDECLQFTIECLQRGEQTQKWHKIEHLFGIYRPLQLIEQSNLSVKNRKYEGKTAVKLVFVCE